MSEGLRRSGARPAAAALALAGAAAPAAAVVVDDFETGAVELLALDGFEATLQQGGCRRPRCSSAAARSCSGPRSARTRSLRWRTVTPLIEAPGGSAYALSDVRAVPEPESSGLAAIAALGLAAGAARRSERCRSS